MNSHLWYVSKSLTDVKIIWCLEDVGSDTQKSFEPATAQLSASFIWTKTHLISALKIKSWMFCVSGTLVHFIPRTSCDAFYQTQQSNTGGTHFPVLHFSRHSPSTMTQQVWSHDPSEARSHHHIVPVGRWLILDFNTRVSEILHQQFSVFHHSLVN